MNEKKKNCNTKQINVMSLPQAEWECDVETFMLCARVLSK